MILLGLTSKRVVYINATKQRCYECSNRALLAGEPYSFSGRSRPDGPDHISVLYSFSRGVAHHRPYGTLFLNQLINIRFVHVQIWVFLYNDN